MNYIRANKDNTIHLVSNEKLEDTVEYNSELPEDFYHTFSKGKYLFIDNEIVLNLKWNEANQEVETLSDNVPHRDVLIEAGVSSIEELQEIEDLTSLPGIGTAKAQDITNYLTNQNGE